MTEIRKFFGQRSDRLAERADALVEVTIAAAIDAYMPLFNEFAILENASEEQFDFCFTIAGIHAAIILLQAQNFPADREGALMDRVARQLSAWNREHGIGAIQDCKLFFDRTVIGLEQAGADLKFIAADTLGGWVTLNIFDKAPETDEELRLARTIGVMIVHGLHDWWEE